MFFYMPPLFQMPDVITCLLDSMLQHNAVSFLFIYSDFIKVPQIFLHAYECFVCLYVCVPCL